MAKADLTRDYYADLELPPGADVNDVKKQFKKLALKYHPDRNIGRESEVNAKFQVIQSAHEILTDPTQKSQYDAGRAKARYSTSGFGSGMNAQRGNPYTDAGSQWAPPPKRNSRSYNPPPSAGAARYKNFETPGGNGFRPNEGPESRRSTYEAWENMRGQTASKHGQQGTKPQAGSSSTGPTPKERSQGFAREAPPRPRPTPEEPNSMPRRSQSTRRAGFMPSDPTGDEPPAATTSAYYSTRSRRSQVPSPQEPPPPPPRSPAANIPDPLKQFRDEVGVSNEPRLSTPYATHGGEKLNPFESVNINRPKSTRERSDSSRGAPFSPTGLNDRHRSASPPRTSRHQPQPSADHVLRTDSDPNLSRQYSRSGRNPAPQPPYNPAAEADSTSSDDMSQTATASPHTKNRTFARLKTNKTRNTPASTQVPPKANKNYTGPQTMNNNGKPIFAYNDVDGTTEKPPPAPNKFTSNSAENISTTFSPDDWDGKFQAGECFMNEQKAANMPSGRARSSSRARGRSPTKPRQGSKPTLATNPIIPDFRSTAQPESPDRSPAGTRFSAEEWASKFKPQTFAPPPMASPVSKPVYSRKGSNKSTRARPAPGAAVAVDDIDSGDDKPLFMGRRQSKPNTATTSGNESSHPSNSAPSPNAMDIDMEDAPKVDSEEPHKDEPASFAKRAAESQARNVPLEPSRPEWRDANGPMSHNTSTKGKRRATKSADSDGFGAINLEDLKNAEPIKQDAKGLNTFDDLAASLPFPSQASSKVPICRAVKSGDLDLPKPPRAPDMPTKVTDNSWRHYLSAFKTYMVDWDIFDCRMMTHFQARRTQVQAMGYNWMEAVGDDGVNQYLEGAEDDEVIRNWWSTAARAHKSSMQDFKTMRDRMKGVKA